MRLAAFLPVLLCAAVPAAAAEPAPLTYSDLGKLSDEALTRRIFGPLAADLFVSNRPEATGYGLLRRGAWLWFWTRPRKDWLRDGLCVADRMIVRLTPAPLSIGTDPGMRLHSVEAETVYIVRDREMATRLSGFDPKELEGQEEACAKLDPRRDSTPAESGWQLMKAFELANQLGAAARAGKRPVPIDCSRIDFLGGPADETECLARLANLGEHRVSAVQSCGDAPAIPGYCIRVQTSDWFIHFILDWREQKMERAIVHGIEDTSAIE